MKWSGLWPQGAWAVCTYRFKIADDTERRHENWEHSKESQLAAPHKQSGQAGVAQIDQKLLQGVVLKTFSCLIAVGSIGSSCPLALSVLCSRSLPW